MPEQKIENKTVYKVDRLARKVKEFKVRANSTPFWAIDSKEEAEQNLADYIERESKAIEEAATEAQKKSEAFKEELYTLLEKYNASIDFAMSDCSDTHGIYDERMEVCFSVNGRMIPILLEDGYSIG